MARIAYLLLAHKDPRRLIEQIGALTEPGDCVVLHFDANAPETAFREIVAAFDGNDRVAFAKRVRCGWGEWSLVQATLGMIETAQSAFDGLTHYYLVSGDCYPTKSRAFIEDYLDRNADCDFVECHDFFQSDWIKTGLKEERLIYRHYFNERSQRTLFYRALDWQRRLGLRRSPPAGLTICIGSQWWLMRAATIARILARLRARPEIIRFFRTTWIPDETFFQTLAHATVPAAEIRCHPPTHLIFSDYGMPIVFYHDHFDYLRAQDKLFARKLSTHAKGLRRRMLEIYRGTEGAEAEAEGGSPGNLYGYLTGRGRHGARFAPRFWERAIGAPEESEILIVTAKMWHIGKAVEGAVSEAAGLPALGYIFDEDLPLPLDLGNLETGRAKRERHRRALINIVLEALGTRRVLFCIDPARLDVVRDLAGIAGQLRILAVERDIPESHLLGHAERVGLIGPGSGGAERREVIAALRYEFACEFQTLHRDWRSVAFRNRLDRGREANILDIGHFLRCPRPQAEAVARAAEAHIA